MQIQERSWPFFVHPSSRPPLPEKRDGQHRSFKAGVLTTTFTAVAIGSTQAAPILTFTTNGTSNAQSFQYGANGGKSVNGISAGWEFTVGNNPITVGALDASINLNFQPSANPGTGITVDTNDNWIGSDVRLFDWVNNTPNVVASANVTTSDPTEGNRTTDVGYFSHAIAPVTLLPKTNYYLVMDIPVTYSATVGYPVSGAFWQDVASDTIDPSIAFDQALFKVNTNVDPTSGNTLATTNYLGTGLFGPNLDLATTAVPEPSSMAVVAVAAAGVLARRRWRRRDNATTIRSF